MWKTLQEPERGAGLQSVGTVWEVSQLLFADEMALEADLNLKP